MKKKKLITVVFTLSMFVLTFFLNVIAYPYWEACSDMSDNCEINCMGTFGQCKPSAGQCDQGTFICKCSGCEEPGGEGCKLKDCAGSQQGCCGLDPI